MDRVAQITLEIRKLQAEQNAELVKLRENAEWYYQVGYFLYDHRMMFLYTAITITVVAGSFYMGYYYGSTEKLSAQFSKLSNLIEIQSQMVLDLTKQIKTQHYLLQKIRGDLYEIAENLQKSVTILQNVNNHMRQIDWNHHELNNSLIELYKINEIFKEKNLQILDCNMNIADTILRNKEAIDIIIGILNAGS